MDSRGDDLPTGPWVLALALSLPKLLPDQKCPKTRARAADKRDDEHLEQFSGS